MKMQTLLPLSVRSQLQFFFLLILFKSQFSKSTAFLHFAPSSQWMTTKSSGIMNRYSQISQEMRIPTSNIYHMMNAKRQDLDTCTKYFQKKKDTTNILHKIEEKTHKNKLSYKQKISSLISRMVHKTILILSLFLSVYILSPSPTAWAVESGGRIGGGSFSQSSSSSRVGTARSSSSLSTSRSKYRYNRSTNPPIIISPYRNSNNVYYSSTSPATSLVIQRGPSITDIAIVAAIISFAAIFSRNTGGDDDKYDQVMIKQPYYNKKNAVLEGPLGSGIGICQLTVALDVHNRNSPDSILSKLNRLSKTAKTDSRLGIQSLLTEVALELLRQKSNIFAGYSKYCHFDDTQKAQKEYNRWTVRERQKFKRENVNVFNGIDTSQRRSSNDNEMSSFSVSTVTCAVITLLLAIEGDSTILPSISKRNDIESALYKIATNAKVDDCLKTTEILWTPEESDDTLKRQCVYEDYFELTDV